MLTHVAEIRLVVEPPAAGLAAARRDNSHIEGLEAAFREMALAVEDHSASIAADLAFNRLILDAAGNPVLTQMVETIRLALEGVRQVTVTFDEGPASTLELHADVKDNIEAGDAQRHARRYAS